MVRQLDRLDRLAEIGMDIAEALGGQAKGGAEIVAGDIALAFDRVSRAVRITSSLQSLLIAHIDARDDGREIAGPTGAKAASNDDDGDFGFDDFYYRDEGYARDIPLEMVRQAEAERAEQAERPTEHDRPERDRPDPDPYADLLKRPVHEVIARICKDLGLDAEHIRKELDSGRPDTALAELFANEQPPPRPPHDTETEAEGP